MHDRNYGSQGDYPKPHQEPLFISDTHFFHKNIIKFCPNTRQGKDAIEMTNILVKNWNEQVEPGRDVYHLGDVSFGPSTETLKVLKRLNGNIHLILGNHDRRSFLEKSGYFASIQSYKELNIRGLPWVLFHYPIFEWNRMHHGAIHLYGHVHGRPMVELPEGKCMDVGVDTRPNADMKLWTVDEILERLKDKPIRKHHEGPQDG